ncbi:MAG: hypothetical protein PHD32_01445 [Eubacteriales bacterium]|nr:hypothetical protein [Eubacteriales bacterium]
MIKEISKAKFAAPFRYVVAALLLASVVVALSALAGVVRVRWGIAHPEYVIYVGLLALGVWAFFFYSTEYHYTLIDDELIIEKMRLSRRVDRRIIRTFNIVAYGTRKAVGPLSREERRALKRYVAPHQKACYVAMPGDTGRVIIAFSPSEHFLEQFRQSVEKQHREGGAL